MSATTWVALLRGINVGRAKRVAMADLRALLERLGYDDVRTHLQSGNALFTTSGGRAGELEDRIAAQIDTELGLNVAVLVRSAADLARVIEANPFAGPKADSTQLHVVFLSARPPAKRVAALDPGEFAPDEFAFGDRVIHLRLPHGVMGSKLPDCDKFLGVAASQRSWNTVTRLNELAAELGG